jgi:hypothetical protein
MWEIHLWHSQEWICVLGLIGLVVGAIVYRIRIWWWGHNWRMENRRGFSVVQKRDD